MYKCTNVQLHGYLQSEEKNESRLVDSGVNDAHHGEDYEKLIHREAWAPFMTVCGPSSWNFVLTPNGRDGVA